MINDNQFKWNKDLIQQCINKNQFEKLNKKDKEGYPGFIWACKNQPKLALIMLERNNVDFNTQNNFGNTGFITACINQSQLAKIMLEQDNINFNIQNKVGNTGFIVVCSEQPELIIPMLKNKKINTSLKNSDGKTGWDIAKEYNPESFKIYQEFLIKQQHQKLKSNITSENKTKKTKSLL